MEYILVDLLLLAANTVNKGVQDPPMIKPFNYI